MRHPKTPETKIITTAADLCPGDRAVVTGLSTDSITDRLRDLGITEGCLLECVGVSPLGDPAAYRIRGAVIAIRKKDALLISAAGERI